MSMGDGDRKDQQISRHNREVGKLSRVASVAGYDASNSCDRVEVKGRINQASGHGAYGGDHKEDTMRALHGHLIKTTSLSKLAGSDYGEHRLMNRQLPPDGDRGDYAMTAAEAAITLCLMSEGKTRVRKRRFEEDQDDGVENSTGGSTEAMPKIENEPVQSKMMKSYQGDVIGKMMIRVRVAKKRKMNGAADNGAKYICKICSMGFDSPQSLGGHTPSCRRKNNLRAGHKKAAGRKAIGAPGMHKCGQCQMTFSSGQSLGGHMTQHRRNPLNQEASAPTDLGSNRRECGSGHVGAGCQ